GDGDLRACRQRSGGGHHEFVGAVLHAAGVPQSGPAEGGDSRVRHYPAGHAAGLAVVAGAAGHGRMAPPLYVRERPGALLAGGGGGAQAAFGGANPGLRAAGFPHLRPARTSAGADRRGTDTGANPLVDRTTLAWLCTARCAVAVLRCIHDRTSSAQSAAAHPLAGYGGDAALRLRRARSAPAA